MDTRNPNMSNNSHEPLSARAKKVLRAAAGFVAIGLLASCSQAPSEVRSTVQAPATTEVKELVGSIQTQPPKTEASTTTTTEQRLPNPEVQARQFMGTIRLEIPNAERSRIVEHNIYADSRTQEQVVNGEQPTSHDEVLDKGVLWYQNSHWIGKDDRKVSGNMRHETVIAGHNVTQVEGKDVFYDLEKMRAKTDTEEGDKITVSTADGSVAVYEVMRSRPIKVRYWQPGEESFNDAVGTMHSADEEWVSLNSCHPDESEDERWVVNAKRIA